MLPFWVVQNNCHKQPWGSLVGWGYPRGHMGNRQHLLQSQNREPWAGCFAQESLRWAPTTVGWDSWAPGHGTARKRGLLVLCSSGADVWLKTPYIRAWYMYKLHMHTLCSLPSGGDVCQTSASNRGHPSYKLLWNKLKQNASKDHISQRRAWSGRGFLSEFSRQKKGRGSELFWFRYWVAHNLFNRSAPASPLWKIDSEFAMPGDFVKSVDYLYQS